MDSTPITCRSWLTVPAHDEALIASALGVRSHAVVLDLAGCNDMQRPVARRLTTEWLGAHRMQVLESRSMARWVRISAMNAGRHWREDLLAVIPAAPDGIVLPGAEGPDQVRQLAAELYEIEQQNGLVANSTRLLPVVGGTAASALQIRRFVEDGHQRIIGLSWNPAALAASLGASRHASVTGKWTDVSSHVRAELLLTAHACGIAAIDAVQQPADKLAQLEKQARITADEGFTGLMLDDSAQVALVNSAFAERDQARDELAPVVEKKLAVARRQSPFGEREERGKTAPVLRPA